MTHAAAFVLGVLAGLLVGLWLIARSVATPETASVPRDVYVEELVDLGPRPSPMDVHRARLRWN